MSDPKIVVEVDGRVLAEVSATVMQDLEFQWYEAHYDHCGCDGPFVKQPGLRGCHWPKPESLRVLDELRLRRVDGG